MGVLTRVLAALSALTGEEEAVKSTSGMVHVSIKDEVGVDVFGDAKRVVRAADDYAAAPASTTTTLPGGVGSVLDRVVCVVTAAGTAQVQIQDGANAAITILPGTVGAVGTYVIELGARSTNGPWKIICGAGVTAVPVGIFSS